MYKWSEVSLERLNGCHPALIEVMNTALQYVDIGITCGKRTKEEQRVLVKKKLSQTMNSRHIPGGDEDFSRAVDIVILSNGIITWKPVVYRIVGPAIVEIGRRKGHAIRWGGDWDQDGDQNDQSFNDLCHFEIN